MALNSIGKNSICVQEKELLDRYKYLDPNNRVISFEKYQTIHPDFKIELFIITDAHSSSRIGSNLQTLSEKSNELLFIDHHPAPKELAAIHCIDSSKAATGELVGELIKALNVPYTKEISLSLYTAILIDTSSFRYPTVTHKTHELVAELLKTGLSSTEAYNKIYGDKEISYLKLLGNVLVNTNSNKDRTISWLSLTLNDLKHFNIDAEDTHAFVNHLLILNNIKIGCMFRELDKNTIKVSFRAAGNIDVGIMAQAMGGGGHNHSAATILKGKLNQIIKDVVYKLELMLKNHSSK